jgi:hypothetical protein
VITAIVVTGSAAALGEHSDHQFPQRPVKVPLRNLDLTLAGANQVDRLARLGPVQAQDLEGCLPGESLPPARVGTAGSVHGADEHRAVTADPGDDDHHRPSLCPAGSGVNHRHGRATKLLMMVEASVSLGIAGLVISRAINILK